MRWLNTAQAGHARGRFIDRIEVHWCVRVLYLHSGVTRSACCVRPPLHRLVILVVVAGAATEGKQVVVDGDQPQARARLQQELQRTEAEEGYFVHFSYEAPLLVDGAEALHRGAVQLRHLVESTCNDSAQRRHRDAAAHLPRRSCCRTPPPPRRNAVCACSAPATTCSSAGQTPPCGCGWLCGPPRLKARMPPQSPQCLTDGVEQTAARHERHEAARHLGVGARPPCFAHGVVGLGGAQVHGALLRLGQRALACK